MRVLRAVCVSVVAAAVSTWFYLRRRGRSSRFERPLDNTEAHASVEALNVLWDRSTTFLIEELYEMLLSRPSLADFNAHVDKRLMEFREISDRLITELCHGTRSPAFLLTQLVHMQNKMMEDMASYRMTEAQESCMKEHTPQDIESMLRRLCVFSMIRGVPVFTLRDRYLAASISPERVQALFRGEMKHIVSLALEQAVFPSNDLIVVPRALKFRRTIASYALQLSHIDSLLLSAFPEATPCSRETVLSVLGDLLKEIPALVAKSASLSHSELPEDFIVTFATEKANSPIVPAFENLTYNWINDRLLAEGRSLMDLWSGMHALESDEAVSGLWLSIQRELAKSVHPLVAQSPGLVDAAELGVAATED